MSDTSGTPEISRFSERNIVDKDRPKTDEEAYELARQKYPDDPFPLGRVFVEAETGRIEDYDFTDDPVLTAIRKQLGLIDDTSPPVTEDYEHIS